MALSEPSLPLPAYVPYRRKEALSPLGVELPVDWPHAALDVWSLSRADAAKRDSRVHPPSSSYSRLPLYYFAFGHLCLAGAFLVMALRSDSFVGFFYHPRMVGVVHLVTLGWITSSILGALYMIAPMALRSRLPVGRLDWWVFWTYSISVAGMASHFWIDEINGMLWAAHLVLGCLIFVGVKIVRAIRRARIPWGVKLHFVLAFVNIVFAGSFGVLVGFNKIFGFLPGFVLTNVYAHAHLAGLGWVLMLIMGAGYRLLPMILPSAAPSGLRLVLGAILMETGCLGLFLSLIFGGAWTWIFALLTAGGIGVFLRTVLWMKRHPRRPARGLPRPDLGRIHIVQALIYLILATVLGLTLVFLPESLLKYRLAPVYGVVALLGIFAQMILGVSLRLLPLFVWLRASQQQVSPSRPYDARPAGLQLAVSILWSLGIPLLAVGSYRESTAQLALASWMLLVAVLGNAASQHLVQARTRRGSA